MTDDEVYDELVKCFEHDPATNNDEFALRERLLSIVRREGGEVFDPPQVTTWHAFGEKASTVWIFGKLGRIRVALVEHADAKRLWVFRDPTLSPSA